MGAKDDVRISLDAWRRDGTVRGLTLIRRPSNRARRPVEWTSRARASRNNKAGTTDIPQVGDVDRVDTQLKYVMTRANVPLSYYNGERDRRRGIRQ